MRSRIPAGLLDSGLTAVGTFVIGIYAVAQIGELPDDLGVYAVYMAGYLFVAAVTTQVMFIPAEKVTLALEPADRTRLAGAILRKGLPVAASMSLLVGIATIIAVATGARTELIWPFWITATLAGVATPLQDHIRRLLHLAERSWLTARVSGAQVLAAVGYLVLFHQIAPSRVFAPSRTSRTRNDIGTPSQCPSPPWSLNWNMMSAIWSQRPLSRQSSPGCSAGR